MALMKEYSVKAQVDRPGQVSFCVGGPDAVIVSALALRTLGMLLLLVSDLLDEYAVLTDGSENPDGARLSFGDKGTDSARAMEAQEMVAQSAYKAFEDAVADLDRVEAMQLTALLKQTSEGVSGENQN